MIIQSISSKVKNTTTKEKYDENLKKLRKESEKMVKGMFEFIDTGSGCLEFCHRYFPGEPILKITIMHGETTELPMGIIKQLNNTRKKIRTFPSVDLKENGPLNNLGNFEYISRVRFTPSEFL